MKTRKGISTFIATLLLMVLAVSAGVVIYAYTMGYLGGFGGQESLGSMSIDEESAVAASGDTNGTITAFIRNTGKTTLKLGNSSGARVYIDGELAYNWTDVTIEENKVAKMEIVPTNSSALEAGKSYDVKIIASDNTQISFSVKAQ